jgi:uncharacterized membrane protein YkoI
MKTAATGWCRTEILAAVIACFGRPVLAQDSTPRVSLEHCLKATTEALGGDVLHLEFEAWNGRPTYEFIIGTSRDTYYVGCDAVTGLIGEVDVIVEGGDPRWQAVAKVDESTAVKTATERYKGEVEEVKRLLLASGGAAYEVDVEIGNADGEYNV